MYKTSFIILAGWWHICAHTQTLALCQGISGTRTNKSVCYEQPTHSIKLYTFPYYNIDIIDLFQVSEQVLTDQMQNTINQMVRTFIEAAENFILVRINPLRILNGDLQALALVSSSKRVHLTKELLNALVIIRARIEQAATIINAAINGNLTRTLSLSLSLSLSHTSSFSYWLFLLGLL